MDKRKEKIMDKIKKQTCCYLIHDEETGEVKKCGKKQMMTVSLPILRRTEDGKIVNVDSNEEEGSALGVAFCDEHVWYAMSGLFGIVMEGDKSFIHGPFAEIELMEKVVSAMVMNGKIQEMIKSKEEGEKQVQNIKSKEELKCK